MTVLIFFFLIFATRKILLSMKKLISLTFLIFLFSNLYSQCPVGQVQIAIVIHTDDYGKEGYWQLVPSGNSCGTGTIASGGNNNVGCNGGGQQNNPNGGYASNSTVNAGPWCINIGDTLDIIYTDDWADGGFTFDVFIAGYPVITNLTGTGDSPGTRFTFVAAPPPSHDVSCVLVKNKLYEKFGNTVITGLVKNTGTDTVTSVDIHYSIDNGIVQSAIVSGLNILPFQSALVQHSIPWSNSVIGEYDITLYANNPNGVPDANSTNDTAYKTVSAGPGIPNIIDNYIGVTPVLTEIGNSSDSIAVPRDLDFHPILTRNELWVILKSTEAIGGKTVKFTQAGQAGQTSLLQKDGNAWHFMSLPTAIAFSDNGNFATSPGVYDANHDGGNPFTGPTLWSSDPAIYAQPSGGNGSHLDMLHQSPHAMGICADEENAFWVFDDNDQDIVYYDFKEDHGPGKSYHGDAIIRRYSGLNVSGEPTHHVPSHLILDKSTNMLYIVDTGNDRVLRMDVTTGAFSQNLNPYEAVVEYSTWSGAVFNVFADSGFTTPCGIDFIDNRLIVSDYATGDIIIYDNSSSTGVEIGRIVTGTPGIMGVKIGPDGKIWYVNAMTNQVVRLDILPTGIQENSSDNFILYPNPAASQLNILMKRSVDEDVKVSIYDFKGALVQQTGVPTGEKELHVNVSGFSSGVYTVAIRGNKTSVIKKFIRD
jgi:hypothetical protein